MKKLFLIIGIVLLIGISGAGLLYFFRDWQETESFTAYYYIEEDKKQPSSRTDNSKEEAFPYPAFLDNYPENRLAGGEFNTSWDYSRWKLQLDNMLLHGSVSLILYDKDGKVLYEKKQITEETESFEVELDRDIVKHISWYAFIEEKEGEAEGQLTVSFWGK